VKEIARRSGVTQQAVSKALLKHVRDACGRSRTAKRDPRCPYCLDVQKANQSCERAQSDKVLLKFIGMALDLMEREAKLLGLDAETRNRMKRRPRGNQPQPGGNQIKPTIWSLLAQVAPTDLETITRIQELEPIKKPEQAKKP
jgi:hypothetical protein